MKPTALNQYIGIYQTSVRANPIVESVWVTTWHVIAFDKRGHWRSASTYPTKALALAEKKKLRLQHERFVQQKAREDAEKSRPKKGTKA